MFAVTNSNLYLTVTKYVMKTAKKLCWSQAQSITVHGELIPILFTVLVVYIILVLTETMILIRY